MQVKETQEEIKIKEYLNKYVKELQRHFEVPPKRMRFLLYEVYKELKPANFIDNLFSMVKSFYINRGEKNGNKSIS